MLNYSLDEWAMQRNFQGLWFELPTVEGTQEPHPPKKKKKTTTTTLTHTAVDKRSHHCTHGQRPSAGTMGASSVFLVCILVTCAGGLQHVLDSITLSSPYNYTSTFFGFVSLQSGQSRGEASSSRVMIWRMWNSPWRLAG